MIYFRFPADAPHIPPLYAALLLCCQNKKTSKKNMKKIVILGAGTAGTMMANHLNHELDKETWKIDIIDHRQEHYYQPGYLFMPFDIYGPEDIINLSSV